MRTPRRPDDEGDGHAAGRSRWDRTTVIATALGTLLSGVAALIAVWVGNGPDGGSSPGAGSSSVPTPGAGGPVSATASVTALRIWGLRPAECFDHRDAAPYEDVTHVPCEQLHDAEFMQFVEATSELGGTYPGDQGLESFASSACLGVFANYIGTPADRSIYDVWWFYPGQPAWDAGDTQVACAAERDDHRPIQGSIAGAGI